MKKIIKYSLVVLFVGLGLNAIAKENINPSLGGGATTSPSQTLSFNCLAGTAQTLLDINNVRTTIMNGGDMWWNLSDGRYEIPKGSGKHSMFAGALWIGGLNDNDQIKVAAQTYRQDGNDYWPGPLDNVRLLSDQSPNANYGSTNAAICSAYDKHYVITRAEVEEFVAFMTSEEPSVDFPDYQIPQSIIDYPGNRETDDLSDAFTGADTIVGTHPYYAQETLAPFRDVDMDGFYNPSAGDYPEYNLDGSYNCKESDMLFGDQTLWWVYNDNGNTHTATSSLEAIGLEIQAQAFAFSTNDETNNMTFYNYKLINRSHEALNETYFGVWVDPDLGNYQDDYVGCDVNRGLGYCYNGDEDDETAAGYGENPPAIGVDFFRGPLADEGDGLDNDMDGVIDEPGEQIIMSKFVYYDNDFTPFGNPEETIHYYNYLKGIWKNNIPMTNDGLMGRTAPPEAPECNYVFPEDTDPEFPTVWTEQTAGNTPADRRFLQTAGPFTLAPGALNVITTGVVWARANEGGAWASVELMKLADDKAQKLFDVCFEVLDGPDAPEMTIQELDQELIIALSNKVSSNNTRIDTLTGALINEAYVEADEVNIIGYYDDAQTLPYRNEYVFEGYQVFQLKDETVTASDLYNVDKARMIFQCDVRNFRGTNGVPTDDETDSPIDQLVNFNFSQDLQASIPQDMTLEAANDGIIHTFSVTQDLFAPGDRTLVNNKTYHYTVVAYAYNEFLVYTADQVPDPGDMYAPSFYGQKTPYLGGRKNIKSYHVIPHIPNAEAIGTIQNADYGTIPGMTRIEGTGNAGIELEFTDATRTEIIENFCISETGYTMNHAPAMIKVVDPLMVPEGAEFTFIMDEVNSSANWVLINETTGDSIFSEQTIAVQNEQVIADWGLSLTIMSAINPGDDEKGTNGFLSAEEIKGADATWLSYVRDADAFFDTGDFGIFIDPTDWIRSGATVIDHNGLDDGQTYETVLGGTWAPYRLVAAESDNFPHGVAWDQFQATSSFKDLNSVDVVFTDSTSLWTRVPVIETQNGEGRLELKSNTSLDIDFNEESGTGWSWFPGYALDLEKGTRLNIMFGEASDLEDDNGNDMLWNPTSSLTLPQEQNVDYALFGGRHYVYIMKSTYAGDDETQHEHYNNLIGMSSNNKKRKVFADAGWVTIPVLTEGAAVSEGDITVKLRVSKAYDEYLPCQEDEDEAYPWLTFNTNEIQTVLNDETTAKNALDFIKVVPNPYYGGSNYETGQLDHRVKITNLPKTCTISIYNVAGTLVRQEKLDSEVNVTGWDWDLKNDSGISIASGVYIIHIDAGDLGEKVLKWFGSLRPIDLDSF